MSMKHPSTLAVIASLLGALGMTAAAQQPSGDSSTVVTKDSSPGKATMAQTHTIVATVEAVDAAQASDHAQGPQRQGGPVDRGTRCTQPRAGQGRRPRDGSLSSKP